MRKDPPRPPAYQADEEHDGRELEPPVPVRHAPDGPARGRRAAPGSGAVSGSGAGAGTTESDEDFDSDPIAGGGRDAMPRPDDGHRDEK